MLVAAPVIVDAGGTSEGWYGWHEPGNVALAVSAIYKMLPDESQGAQFFVERRDKDKMPFLDDATLVGEWYCTNGNTVQAWLLLP